MSIVATRNGAPTPRQSPDGRTAHDDGCPDDRAWRARHRRLLHQVEQALERSAGHRDEHADWDTVAAILERLHCELSRDLREGHVHERRPG